MAVNVIIFGQLVDITGTGNFTFENVNDTNQLIQELTNKFPALSNSKFAIAVDKVLVKDNTPLNNNNTVALLPPYSGG
jgi:molybdopterin synthase sulfur carrier subunit